MKTSVLYLEAEESDGVDDVVLFGGADARKHRRHVVHPDEEEEQEAQQMAPDIHRLVGQDEEAARGGLDRNVIKIIFYYRLSNLNSTAHTGVFQYKHLHDVNMQKVIFWAECRFKIKMYCV